MKTLEIIMVLVAALLAFATKQKWQDMEWIVRISLIVAIFAALLVAYNGIIKNKKEALLAKIKAEFGKIEDKTKVVIPKMRMGNSESFFIAANGLIADRVGNNLLKVFVQNNRIVVTAIVRDLDRKVVTAINKNEWSKYDNDFEYNNDDNAYEVVSAGDHKVYLQVELKNGIANIHGLFMSEENGSVGTYLTGKNNSHGEMLLVYPNQQFIFPKVKPLFKYPRGAHFGKREEK